MPDSVSISRLSRSLGRKYDFNTRRISRLLALDVRDLDRRLRYRDQRPLVSYLRCCVILGFIPGNPRLLLVILNPSMMHYQATFLSWSLMVLQIAPSTGPDAQDLRLIAMDYEWLTGSRRYEDLRRVDTVISVNGSQSTLLQVLQYDGNLEQGAWHDESGVLEFRMCSIDALLRLRDGGSTEGHTFCTNEVSSARLCFAHPIYQVALLRTRCMFILSREAYVRKSAKFWTLEQTRATDTDDGQSSGHMLANIFEIDVFIEALMKKQQHLFGNPTFDWHYLTVFHPEQDTIVLDRHDLNKQDGIFLIVTILAEDHKSILQAVLFVTPLASHTSADDSPGVIALSAKRWQLKRKAVDIQSVLLQVVRQQFGIQTDEHNCAVDCKQNDRLHFLAKYDRADPASLDMIEGDIWHITGKSWTDKVAT